MNQVKFKKDCGGRSKYFRTDRKKDRVGDCAIRSCAIATGRDYNEVRRELWDLSFESGEMPNSDNNIEAFLKLNGFEKKPAHKHSGNRRYIIGNFPVKRGKVYVVRCSKHLTVIKSNTVRDTWDCRRKAAQSYYVK